MKKYCEDIIACFTQFDLRIDINVYRKHFKSRQWLKNIRFKNNVNYPNLKKIQGNLKTVGKIIGNIYTTRTLKYMYICS